MENSALAQKFTPRSILKFTLPNVVMMIFMSLYTIVDGMFISRLAGEMALSATNMFYPVTSTQLGIGIMFGAGGSAVIASKMGAGGEKEARQDFTLLTCFIGVIGFIIMVLCLIFLEPLLLYLGTSAGQMPYCVSYARIMLIFSPILFFQVVFQMYFVTAGKPNSGLFLNVAGGIANMILDYIFMGPLKMGVAGAAFATGIGYSITAFAGLAYFTFKRDGSLYFVKFPVRIKTITRTCSNGISEMVTNVAIAVTTFMFNLIFMHYWQEDGIAAITIMSYFQFVFSAVFSGYSMGVSPLISFKYGAKDKDQLKCIFKFNIIFVLTASIAVYIIALSSINFALAFFTDPGSRVFNISIEGFPIYAVQFLFMGFSILASATFTALGNGLISGIISLSRTFIFLVGSLLILPSLLAETGVWLAVPAAEFLGLIVSLGFLIYGRRKYNYF